MLKEQERAHGGKMNGVGKKYVTFFVTFVTQARSGGPRAVDLGPHTTLGELGDPHRSIRVVDTSLLGKWLLI